MFLILLSVKVFKLFGGLVVNLNVDFGVKNVIKVIGLLV